MTYTIDQIRQAGKEGEVNHLDVEHIIDLLKEGSDKPHSTETGQQGELITRLKNLKPFHISPYNLGDMGEIAQIIDKLKPSQPDEAVSLLYSVDRKLFAIGYDSDHEVVINLRKAIDLIKK